MDIGRIPTGGLPPTSMPNVPVRPQSQSNSIVSPTSIVSSTVGGVGSMAAQALPLNKSAKKPRKDGEPERDVQSPAYSDISDDSTPVDSDAGGKFPQIHTLCEKTFILTRITIYLLLLAMLKDKHIAVKPPADMLPKKPMDVGPPHLGPLNPYGMYSFYPPHAQAPYLVQSPQSQPTDLQNKPQGPPQPQSLTPTSVADYSKMKEPPLDLMTKPAPPNDSQALNLKDGMPTGPQPPPMAQSKYMPGGYYPYK